MGNRAVIVSSDTTKENINEKIGIYVHWYGDKSYVEKALKEAKEIGIRTVSDDPSYFWARFCQIFANIISNDGVEESGIGIDIVSHLDYTNYENGVYYIDDNFEIVKQTDGEELEN